VNNLGRIKTKKIKRNTREIFKDMGDIIVTDFEKNKELIRQRYNISSKKLKNIISGYCTRLKKNEE
jgi:ribosomal protein S17E